MSGINVRIIARVHLPLKIELFFCVIIKRTKQNWYEKWTQPEEPPQFALIAKTLEKRKENTHRTSPAKHQAKLVH
jgi:hypothetical protein